MNNEPATRQDVQDLEQRIGMEAMEERLVEKMRDMQTEVLRPFHD
jgi:hypothetical protein